MGKLLSKGDKEGSQDGEPQDQVPAEATPTVVPQPEDEFDAAEDAKTLNGAFQSFGANEAAITAILANRSWEQRLEICEAYQEAFKKSLMTEVEKELSGDYKTALEWLLQDPDSRRVLYISMIIHDGQSSRNPDKRGKDVALLETVFPLTPTELRDLQRKYKEVSGTDLWKDIDGKVTGPFKDWVVELVKTTRNEAVLAESKIAKDVKTLRELSPDLWTNEVEDLHKLFIKASLANIYMTLRDYVEQMGQKVADIMDKVPEEFRDAFTVMVTACMNGYEFFADGLYQSMKGIGTNDAKLIYILIDRAEYDLENIKVVFKIKYGKTLESFVKDDTSGDYKNLLVAILEIKSEEPEDEQGGAATEEQPAEGTTEEQNADGATENNQEQPPKK